MLGITSYSTIIQFSKGNDKSKKCKAISTPSSSGGHFGTMLDAITFVVILHLSSGQRLRLRRQAPSKPRAITICSCFWQQTPPPPPLLPQSFLPLPIIVLSTTLSLILSSPFTAIIIQSRVHAQIRPKKKKAAVEEECANHYHHRHLSTCEEITKGSNFN